MEEQLDLLFSICGLTIFSIVVCTLSAIMCCIQIFSVDILHVLSPPRSSSLTLDCTSPPDTFLQHMLDLDEFVPPVPPPPYYPPEYTCSSETDAQSITYNGSMDSPVPLYPTDFPPSYEAVMGLRGDSQVNYTIAWKLVRLAQDTFETKAGSPVFPYGDLQKFFEGNPKT
ncbi:protein FAM189B-like [Protobothrops mucrosquamatus]|uniref:protein FAM189B-like n=1 Tax=Protobothrops mucrosquamatus TaxID=103944 RepID=UPI000775F570|nr:protein FAM189B-like [Protobothrops mucrosquamatus]